MSEPRAYLVDDDEAIPPNRRQAVNVIRRSGDHLLSVIEGTLDIARIESGKMTLESKPFDFPDFLRQIVDMFDLQTRKHGLEARLSTPLPAQEIGTLGLELKQIDEELASYEEKWLTISEQIEVVGE